MSTGPVVDFADRPFDRRFLFDHPDPYPMFGELGRSQPVFAAEHAGRPIFLLTKYDDCLAALKDAESYSSRSNAEAGQDFLEE
jgi:cytochrome P450